MESEAHLFSFCLLMTEFKATDFPFGKASGPSPQMLLCYILTQFRFSFQPKSYLGKHLF